MRLTHPHKNYCTSAAFTVVSVVTAVESVATAAESTLTAVESVVSFVVDPEPQAANVNATPTASTNVNFLILK